MSVFLPFFVLDQLVMAALILTAHHVVSAKEMYV